MENGIRCLMLHSIKHLFGQNYLVTLLLLVEELDDFEELDELPELLELLLFFMTELDFFLSSSSSSSFFLTSIFLGGAFCVDRLLLGVLLFTLDDRLLVLDRDVLSLSRFICDRELLGVVPRLR